MPFCDNGVDCDGVSVMSFFNLTPQLSSMIAASDSCRKKKSLKELTKILPAEGSNL